MKVITTAYNQTLIEHDIIFNRYYIGKIIHE